MTILSNNEILSRSIATGLINPLNKKCIEGASYELTCSSIYYELTEGGKKIDAKPHGNKILIKPKHTVVLITEENLNIPNDLTAHIVSKGSLFSIGLSPVSTYADPGFSGQIGLVTTNTSDKFIVIDTKQAVAKIHFSQLTSAATISYRGQHGYQTQSWPVRNDLQKDYSEIKHDKRVKSEEEEAMTILPRQTSIALKYIQSVNTKIFASISVAFVLNAIFFISIANKYNFEAIANIATNLISSGILALIAITNSKKNI